MLLVLLLHQLLLLLLIFLIHPGIADAGRSGDGVLRQLTRVRGSSGLPIFSRICAGTIPRSIRRRMIGRSSRSGSDNTMSAERGGPVGGGNRRSALIGGGAELRIRAGFVSMLRLRCDGR